MRPPGIVPFPNRFSPVDDRLATLRLYSARQARLAMSPSSAATQSPGLDDSLSSPPRLNRQAQAAGEIVAPVLDLDDSTENCVERTLFVRPS